MLYDILDLSLERRVTLCGTNVYPQPTTHVERVMDEHDIFYIYDGQWQIIQDGLEYHLNSGDIVLLRAGSHHFGTVPCTANMRNMFVHFNTAPGDRGGVELSAAEALTHANDGLFCIPTVVHCGMENAVTAMLREIIALYWSRRDDSARKLTLLLNQLLNELSYIARNSLAQPEEWITQLLQVIRLEPGRFISLEEAADLVHMSVRSLSSRFRRIMGRSVHEYQVAFKLEAAYNALRTGHYTVKEVSQNFGFTDPFYFSRVFKRHFGIAPSDLKRNQSGANLNRPEMR